MPQEDVQSSTTTTSSLCGLCGCRTTSHHFLLMLSADKSLLIDSFNSLISEQSPFDLSLSISCFISMSVLHWLTYLRGVNHKNKLVIKIRLKEMLFSIALQWRDKRKILKRIEAAEPKIFWFLVSSMGQAPQRHWIPRFPWCNTGGYFIRTSLLGVWLSFSNSTPTFDLIQAFYKICVISKSKLAPPEQQKTL